MCYEMVDIRICGSIQLLTQFQQFQLQHSETVSANVLLSAENLVHWGNLSFEETCFGDT